MFKNLFVPLFFVAAMSTQAGTTDAVTPTTSTAVVVPAAVVVGFIVRCRRKGFPFRSSKQTAGQASVSAG